MRREFMARRSGLGSGIGTREIVDVSDRHAIEGIGRQRGGGVRVGRCFAMHSMNLARAYIYSTSVPAAMAAAAMAAH